MKRESVGGDYQPTRLHTTDKILQSQPRRLTVGLAFLYPCSCGAEIMENH